MNKLRAAFGDRALFFWDARSGRQLGVLWRPALRKPCTFSVLHTQQRAPEMCVSDSSAAAAAASTMTEANLQELVAQMLDLSEGLLLPSKG